MCFWWMYHMVWYHHHTAHDDILLIFGRTCVTKPKYGTIMTSSEGFQSHLGLKRNLRQAGTCASDHC